MSPVNYQEAFNATNPADTEEARDASARAIIAGTAANEAYWNSRGELEALKAAAQGHGDIPPHPDSEASGLGSGTDPAAGSIEGTVTEEPTTALAPGQSGTADANVSDTEAKLRAQLQSHGLTPEV